MSIKFLAEDDRPREKFLLKGRDALSDAELLAIILGSGNREESAIELSRRMLGSVNHSWDALAKLTLKDLMKYNGIGEAKAISIAATMEISRRRSSQTLMDKQSITSSKEAYAFFRPLFSDLQVEEFWAVYINNKNKVLHFNRLSSGGISQTVVDSRILFKTALDHYATSIFVAHNHPSGDAKPSQEDKTCTKTIFEAGKIMNIKLIDHLIITPQAYFSFADEGYL